MMLRNNRPVQSWAKRMIHTAPRLKLQDQYTTQGIPGLLSPNGFKLAWIDQQNYLTTKLTLLTNGTSDETRYPFHIAINSARDQTKQPIFNVASQCHNNHFFFEQLTSPLTNTTSPSRDLENRIIDRFGSLDGLKKQFIEESEKIIGQGWVFLVETESKSLEILIVNNSGTPYNFSGNLSLDLNGPINSDEFEAWEAIKEHTLNKTTDWTIPLLGVSLWDHAYILDYGVGQRAKYVGDALDAINWEVVNKRVYV